jgi:hypothetical protein
MHDWPSSQYDPKWQNAPFYKYCYNWAYFRNTSEEDKGKKRMQKKGDKE